MVEEDFPGAVEPGQRAGERTDIVPYQFDGLDLTGRAVDPSIRAYEGSIKIIALGARVTTIKVLVDRSPFPGGTVIGGLWIGEVDYRATATGIRVPGNIGGNRDCLLYTSPSPRDRTRSRMPSSA